MIDLNEKLSDWQLPARVLNSLRAENIQTAADLYQKHPRHLRIIPNLGKMSLFEINRALADRGLPTTNDWQNWLDLQKRMNSAPVLEEKPKAEVMGRIAIALERIADSLE